MATIQERVDQTEKREKCADLQLELFPDADVDWVRQQFAENENVTVSEVADIILSRENFDQPIIPRQTETKKTNRAKNYYSSNGTQPDTRIITTTYPKVFNQVFIGKVDEMVLTLLKNEFRIVSTKSLHSLVRQSSNHFAVAWALLTMAAWEHEPPLVLTDVGLPQSRYEQVVDWGTSKVTVIFTVLRCLRPRVKEVPVSRESEAINKDIALVDQVITQAIQPGTSSAPLQRSDSEERDAATSFECAICCEEYDKVNAVYCVASGHVFCRRCVSAQAKEVAYGQQGGQSAGGCSPAGSLACLDSTCDSFFPPKALKMVLDTSLRKSLSEQLLEQSINAADLENFERCRYCNWGAIMEVSVEQDKVFRCRNETCLEKTCRQCGKKWDNQHIGKPCAELEKNKARLELEEKMSEAVIRRCPKCKIPYNKIEGCNRMTCRCGFTMCYLCRMPKADYKHYCPHPIDLTDAKCPENCGQCMLWEVAAVRDEQALKEIQNAAAKQQPM